MNALPSNDLRPLRRAPPPARRLLALALAPLAIACGDTPHTTVVLENHYPTSAASPLVIYDAFWHSVSFQGSPLSPGAAAEPPLVDGAAQLVVPTSGATAYAVLAPGWDPASTTPPTKLVVLQSRGQYALHLNGTLRIVVDDTSFAGDCAAGDPLPQAQADYITERVFPADFAGLQYDAATCTVSALGGRNAP